MAELPATGGAQVLDQSVSPRAETMYRAPACSTGRTGTLRAGVAALHGEGSVPAEAEGIVSGFQTLRANEPGAR